MVNFPVESILPDAFFLHLPVTPIEPTYLSLMQIQATTSISVLFIANLQQKTDNFSPNPEKDDCRIQETQTIDESRELEADTPKLLARSTRQFIGSSEVYRKQ